MPIRVLVADDHQIVRAGLKRWFEETEVSVVAEAETPATLVQLAAECQPDVALVEIRLAGGDGLRAMALAKQQMPKLAAVVFSSHEAPSYAARALAAEASGFVLKSACRDQLLSALRQVAAGKTLWAPEELRRLHGALAAPNAQGNVEVALTPREMEVLSHMAHGLTNKEIGRLLGISSETVKEHVQRLLRKIGVRDRTQAAVWLARRQAG
ncbi:MAG TPA: response regulator transcription factor [Pirellulales bacterium]|nr:response regulator transcription factor [Pirellulales bacterium]